jgi:hypothetical protein
LNFIGISRLVALVSLVVVTAACASVPRTNGGAALGLEETLRTPEFSFETDTFAFANLIGARHPNAPDIYAHYCFVLARGVRQFTQFARFEPALPKLDRGGYIDRVKRVVARPARAAALPLDDRVVIPGYANLREFSRDEESAVKEGLGGRFWTWVHWTNWRVMLRVDGEHQEKVVHEIMDGLREGRLVQLLVTNWPKPELNHTVVVYESRPVAGGIEFLVWDPNNPDGPGIMTWDSSARTFWATNMYDTEPGPIRAFRMYYSLLL